MSCWSPAPRLVQVPQHSDLRGDGRRRARGRRARLLALALALFVALGAAPRILACRRAGRGALASIALAEGALGILAGLRVAGVLLGDALVLALALLRGRRGARRRPRAGRGLGRARRGRSAFFRHADPRRTRGQLGGGRRLGGRRRCQRHVMTTDVVAQALALLHSPRVVVQASDVPWASRACSQHERVLQHAASDMRRQARQRIAPDQLQEQSQLRRCPAYGQP